jgi:hypothetical protein
LKENSHPSHCIIYSLHQNQNIMTNSENFEHIADESSVSFWPTAVKTGLIGGLILVVYALIGNMTGFSIPSSIVGSVLVGLLSIVFVILIGVYAVRQHRNNELKGSISFGRAFLVALVALVVAGLIGSAFNILYMTVIDPNYAETVMSKMEEMFSNFGMDESMMETQLEATRNRLTTSAMLKNGLLWGNVINAVIAVIIAAIMKRKPAAFQA